MFGSNDVQDGPNGGIASYARSMLKITDQLLARGVVPILSSAPPRVGSADAHITRYSRVVRGIAQARQIPFVDLERELRKIDGFGLAGDRLHLKASPSGACAFGPRDLVFGSNVRNAVTFEALHRARGATEQGLGVDEHLAALTGEGTAGSPFVAPETDFTDLRALVQSAETSTAGVCGDSAPARFTYLVRADHAGELRVGFLLSGSEASKAYVRSVATGECRRVDKPEKGFSVEAGEHEIVVAAPAQAASEFLLTVALER